MQCSKCGSTNVSVNTFSETKVKHRGCLAWILWIILACLTLGLIIIIPILTNKKTKTKTHNEATCQNCGNHWSV